MKSAIANMVFACILLAGCGPKAGEYFVVLRDVPQQPSFVVIPANDYLYQVEFANKVEQDIIGCGVKVVSRPATKEVEAKKQAGEAEAQPSQAKGTQATLTERYIAFEETSADYIVQTYAEGNQVKIIKKESKEILTSFELKSSWSGSNQITEASVMYNALKALGIPVRKEVK